MTNRVEVELSKILRDRFGETFPPVGFCWTIHRCGDQDDKIDLSKIGKSIPHLDAVIQATKNDASLKPMILWRRTRKPWLAIVRAVDLAGYTQVFEFRAHYKEWVVVPLKQLLEVTQDDFWVE